MGKGEEMKRIFRIQTCEKDIELEISKAVAINSPKKMFNLEELPDGTYRLIWSKDLVENFSEIIGIDIIRED